MKKNLIIQSLLLSTSLVVSPFASAAPVQFDTDGAHVIVVKPLDSWSANERANDFINESYQKRHVLFHYFNENGKETGGAGDSELAKEVTADLTPLNFINGGHWGCTFIVLKSATIPVEEMPSLLQLQDRVYKQTVIKNGDPKQLAAKLQKSVWASTIISLAAASIGVNKFGTNFAATGATSGITQQTYELSMTARRAVLAVPPVPFDYSQYKSVDIRAVKVEDRLGQIIIAYKEDKTPEMEKIALAKAIVSIVGADTTLEAIQAEQAKDLAFRQAIWDDCVSAGQCKNE